MNILAVLCAYMLVDFPLLKYTAFEFVSIVQYACSPAKKAIDNINVEVVFVMWPVFMGTICPAAFL